MTRSTITKTTEKTPASVQKTIGKPERFLTNPKRGRKPPRSCESAPTQPVLPGSHCTSSGAPHRYLSMSCPPAERGRQVDSVRTCSNINPPEAQKQRCKYSQVNTWYKGRAIRFTNLGGNFLPSVSVNTIKSVITDFLPPASPSLSLETTEFRGKKSLW